MTDAVWPDGAREAVLLAIHDNKSLPSRMGAAILTALEPFVQQRIEAATRALDDDCRSLRDLQSWVADAVGLAPYMGCYVEEDVLPAVRRVVIERDSLRAEVARLRQERDHANALAEAHRLAVEGARETLNEERAERSQAEQILADVDAERHRLHREVARLREDGERRQAEVLQLRALLAALPISECQASAALQGWWDQMKAVMAGTNPVWLVEPRGCPTPGACSCPGVRLDAARSARGGEG